MRFSLDAAIYRRLPFETSFRTPATLAAQDIAPETSRMTEPPAAVDAPRPPMSRWFETVQGDVSLDDLFR